MNESEALEHLRIFAYTLQKYRGGTAEFAPELSEELKAESWPWVFGDKCPLEQLFAVLDRGKVAPSEYYNFMIILERFMPEIKIATALHSSQNPIPEGPPSPLNIALMGWDDE